MPLNLDPLPLDPTPDSVHRARDWVSGVLTRLDRKDLLDAAELGVSELVTNAILHGRPPISVRVRGTRDHPRIEVRDKSHSPPAVNLEMVDDAHLLSTIGRGLGLVALYSSTWGAELVHDGKVVWFEPTTEPRPDGDLTGEVFDLDRTVAQLLAASGTPDDPLRVRLLDMPVALFARFRQRFYELGREVRLLSLAHGETYPVAAELAEVFLQVEQERRLSRGVEKLDEAIAQGLDRADLEYLVPRSAPATMVRLRDTLERADEFCREQRLLVLAASPLQRDLQRWYLSEFSRQAAGEEPRPWPGPFTLDEPASHA